MIRTLAVAVALAGAILVAPVAQAQPDSSTGPANSKSVANGAAIYAGPTYAGPTGANKGNKVVPTTLATPFGATIARQPGLATAMANGSMVVPTGIPFGFATPMAKGNMVGPATTTTPFSGGIRTRHGRTGGTSLSGALGGLFG
jgi:hypothetical protein